MPNTWTAQTSSEAVKLLEATLALVRAREQFLDPDSAGNRRPVVLVVTLDDGALVGAADTRYRSSAPTAVDHR